MGVYPDLNGYRVLLAVSCALYIGSHFIDCVRGGCNGTGYGLSMYTRHHVYVSSPVAVFGTIYVLSVRALQNLFEVSLDRHRFRNTRVVLGVLGILATANLILYLAVPYLEDDAVYTALHTVPVIVGYSLITVWLWIATMMRRDTVAKGVATAALVVDTALGVFSSLQSLYGFVDVSFEHFLAVIEASMIATTVPLLIYAAAPIRGRPAYLLVRGV